MSRAAIPAIIAAEISCRAEQAEAAISLLDGGATVPFIARYRKEATGGLDDAQLRALDERLTYLRELEDRRDAVIKSVSEQDKLTPELEGKFLAAVTKTELEDLYLPFKPKRRTRAEIARENGLGPLAEAILADASADPDALAAGYVGDKVPDLKAALDGARDIIAEGFAENADTLGRLREHIRSTAALKAKVVPGKEAEGAKFADYFDHREPWSKAPGHRVLAMLRAWHEGIISLDLDIDADDTSSIPHSEQIVAHTNGVTGEGKAAAFLAAAARWAWRVKLRSQLSGELIGEARERAEEEAIRVFARNLKDLLLAAPAGNRVTIGLDPGIRTGVKVAVVDGTGRLLETATVYPFQPKNDVHGAIQTLRALIRKHGVQLVAIGNGTASRETDRLAAEAVSDMPEPRPIKVVVSEAGASVYSASEIASAEMPDVDVSLRGAVSIARRLQDPLAELVKIEPKSIGVGQYQHDVNQYRLAKALDAVVEDAVNAVGVDLNTASAPLLARVSGLGSFIADAIVAHRNANGPFASREQIRNVPRLGDKTFQLAAGFLRIRDGAEPLDASAVHPEAYPLARRIIEACGRDVRSLIGDKAAIKGIDPRTFVDGTFGLPTVLDVLAEFEKPGRDPRPAFKTATFADGVNEIADLKPGMTLEGTVTNVAAFGAFVDIGVHQDGLVHISQIADRFVKDPSEVVKAGDVVKVRVLDVDAGRKRISLSMRKDGGASSSAPDRKPQGAGRRDVERQKRPSRPSEGQGALAAALQAAMRRQ